MPETISQSINKLIDQSTTPLFEYIDVAKPHILSPRLSESQKETLLGYLKYLLLEKSITIKPIYLKAQFRILRDFGASMKRPFKEVELDDFKIYYSSIIDNNNVSNSTLETYENILRKFCSWVYEKDDQLGDWKEMDFKVKMIFNRDKIQERLKLNYKQAMINKKERSVLRYLKSPLLTEDQLGVLNEYHRYLMSGTKKRVSMHCIHGIFRTMHQFGAFIKKPFNTVVQKDFTDYLFDLTETRKVSSSTSDSYKHIIKQFYKFLHYGMLDAKMDYPEIVRDIELDKIDIKKTRNEMLTREEISSMIQHSSNVRDKLMMSLHYEAITRPEELFSIKIGDIRQDDYGFEIDITRIKQKGKTNSKMPFRVIESEPYLREWLNLHPLKKDPDAYLFISLKQTGSYVLYIGLRKIVKKTSRAAGITKRVYPYLFRHSRITHLKQEGWNDDQIKQITGHSDKSDILSNYSHLSPVDVNNKRLKDAGKLKTQDDEKLKVEMEALKPKKCPRCEKMNAHDSRYCNCGMVLDLRTAMEDQKKTESTFETLAKIISDPEKAQVFEMLIKSMKKE